MQGEFWFPFVMAPYSFFGHLIGVPYLHVTCCALEAYPSNLLI